MEISSALKQVHGVISTLSDRCMVLKVKLEDLTFRAQRMTSAFKGGNAGHKDTTFGYDLAGFRKGMHSFGTEVEPLHSMMGKIERQAQYDQEALGHAQTVMRQCVRLEQSLKSLQESALIAHQHIRNSDHKMEAWYIAQEAEEIAKKGTGLPAIANRVVILVSTPPGGAAATPPPA